MTLKKQLEYCPICFENITLKKKFELQCNHDYCKDCLKIWYNKSQVGNKITSLPVEDGSDFLKFHVFSMIVVY